MLKRARGHFRLAHDTLLVPYLAVLLIATTQLTGCAVVKGIFKAGVWTGVIGVLVVVGLIVFGISKLGRRT